MTPSRIECRVDGEIISSLESEDKTIGVLETPVGTVRAGSGRYELRPRWLFGKVLRLAGQFPGDAGLRNYDSTGTITKKQSYHKDGRIVDITITAK